MSNNNMDTKYMFLNFLVFNIARALCNLANCKIICKYKSNNVNILNYVISLSFPSTLHQLALVRVSCICVLISFNVFVNNKRYLQIAKCPNSGHYSFFSFHEDLISIFSI